MPAPDPTKQIKADIPPVSQKTFIVAGLQTTVYGLDELSDSAVNVSCLWLLHPRLLAQDSMAPVAHKLVSSWNSRSAESSSLGVIAVTFDQRNHGTREVEALANEAWRAGNPRHAQDMFSAYHGTALDTSQLITYLPSYIFPEGQHRIVDNMALGTSLGGHCAWLCLLHEPRITAGVVVIGCPDYVSLMTDRARLSKLPSWTESSPPGAKFLGSADFPPSLVEAVERYDPAGLYLGKVASRTAETYERIPEGEERERVVAALNRTIRGKRILNLSGGDDKLVPYARGEPFLKWLKTAVSLGGWYADGGVTVEDLVFAGVGHTMSLEMFKEAIRFLERSLELCEQGLRKQSKI